MLARLGVIIGLICTALPASAQAPGSLCARLDVPEGLELDCTVQGGPAGSASALVRPTDSGFAPLSELRLRRVEEEGGDPGAWLREPQALDLSALGTALSVRVRRPG